MHADSYVLAAVLTVSLLLSGTDIITKSVDDKFKTANQFSVHPYQSSIGQSISMAGPFLSKIRVTPNATRILTATADLNEQTEKYCVSLPEPQQIKCNMSRTAHMYFGDIHSSWSVLGTQSIFTLVKHIFCILLTFSLFWFSENMIYTEDGFFRENRKKVRVCILIAAIVIFVGNVFFDIDDDLYAGDNVAIGSITTGISFCIVCLLIICFTHLHDPVDTASSDPQIEGAKSGDAEQTIQTSEREPLVATAGLFDFNLWTRSSTTSSMVCRRTEDKDRYRRLEDMYLNIHVSYLVLLLTPLFVILALTTVHKVVVDVHVQLIFFSSIFFAVLDIFQTRVMSVLASLTQTDSKTSSAPVGFFLVKGFVVLAFILCKLLVIVPAWQLLFTYYTRDAWMPSWLIIWQIVLFITTSILDLAYISDYFNPASDAGVNGNVDCSSPEKMHVMYKHLMMGFYLVASSATVLYEV